MSRATSLSSAAQQLSLSIGVAVAATLLAFVKPSHATAGLQPADFLPVFVAMAGLCLLSVPFFAALVFRGAINGLLARNEGCWQQRAWQRPQTLVEPPNCPCISIGWTGARAV